MGARLLAFDSAENRQVAVKVLSAEQAPNQKILKLQLEGQHGMLVHPNIVRSYDTGHDADSGLHYIVLEFVDGPSAHELLDRIGKLQVGDAIHIILDIARALEHAHKNRIIHRDIKPGNILLMTSGLAKLADLGLAKRQGDASNLTHASQGIGTPYYMPYEQAMNAKMADERSDIYARLGAAYHLLTGEVRSPANRLSKSSKKASARGPANSLNTDVPDRLEEISPPCSPAIRPSLSDDQRSHRRSGTPQLSATIPSFINLDNALKTVAAAAWRPVEMTRRICTAGARKSRQENASSVSALSRSTGQFV